MGEKNYFYSGTDKILIDDVAEILVLVNGVLRDTSSQVFDSQTYSFPEDQSDVMWKDVDVDINTDPAKWIGWNEFDET